MAIVRIDPPNQVPAETADWQRMLQMVTALGQMKPIIDNIRGYLVPAGSIFYVGGVLYKAESDTYVTGAPFPDRDYYKLADNGSGQLEVSFSALPADAKHNAIYGGIYDTAGALYVPIQRNVAARIVAPLCEVYAADETTMYASTPAVEVITNTSATVYSTDGRTYNTSAQYVSEIIGFGNYIIGINGTDIYKTTDGANWTKVYTHSDGLFGLIKSKNCLFVGTSAGDVLYSYDVDTWSQDTTISGINIGDPKPVYTDVTGYAIFITASKTTLLYGKEPGQWQTTSTLPTIVKISGLQTCVVIDNYVTADFVNFYAGASGAAAVAETMHGEFIACVSGYGQYGLTYTGKKDFDFPTPLNTSIKKFGEYSYFRNSFLLMGPQILSLGVV